MPAIGGVVVTTGARGAQGNTGAAGTMPADPGSLVNGRQTGSWIPSLPLRGISSNATEGTMTGGLFFTHRIATTTTSGHIDLWAGQYGIVNANYNIGLVSGGGYIDFYTSIVSNSTQAMRWYGGGVYREWWFQGDGWRIQHRTDNNDFIYYDYNSSPQFGYQGTYNRMVSWNHYQTLGFMQLGHGSRGIIYANITGVGFKFTWDGYQCWARLDNGNVDWGLANACDERLKSDIEPSTHNCLETIRKIRLWQYRWKDHRIRPGYPRPAKPDAPIIPIGFVAQRLLEDFPQGVQAKMRPPKGFKNLWDHTIRNSDSNTMMALICGAIQELDNEITKRELAANRA